MPQFRVGDRERDEAIAFLRRQCGEGRLTLEEFGDRTSLVHASVLSSDIVPVIDDLPGGPEFAGSLGLLPPPQPAPGVASVRLPRARQLCLAIFGDHRRKGRWRPAADTTAVALFGDIVLDLRDALIEMPYVRIHAVSIFGDVRIIPPAGADVQCSVVSIFGDTTTSGEPPATASSVVIHIDGGAIFGSVRASAR
jgi:hypothetical protein